MDAIPKRCFSLKSTPNIWTFLTLLLVPAAMWCQISFYIFTRQKKDFFKDIFISEVLVKIKEVHFSFFTFSRLLVMDFSFLHV